MSEASGNSVERLSQATRSILVKTTTPPEAFGFSGARFTAQPLFPSIEGAGLGLVGATRWYIVSSSDLDDAHLWDMCHRMVQQDLGIAAGVEFAEPNLRQHWTWLRSDQQAQMALSGCAARDQSQSYPGDPDKRWYLSAGHANFTPANSAAGVRIAHCDTGYDALHLSLPHNLDHERERNFVDAAVPNCAEDRVPPGFLNNIGHGTGTLSILAGAPILGSPTPSPGVVADATIVPIRVANSVVLFENAAIAKAFDYVHALCVGGTFVDVITMSMGGLASQAWADAVNALYDIGVFIVTAAGNNYADLPTRNIVYPARFARVVAACGAMANGAPYADLASNLMAGNYGPASKMDTAMAAYTPNVPWAQIGCRDVINWDGNGTSSATPQIAGAAARWIAQNRAALDAYPEPWMRVEAIRSALFSAARKTNQSHFGQGTLDADTALSEPLPAAATLRRQAPDTATFPLLKVLTGLGIAAPENTPKQAMLELEALQLSQSHTIEQLLPDPEDIDGLTPARRREIADALASQPGVSQSLREALGAVAPRITPVDAPATPAATAAPSQDESAQSAADVSNELTNQLNLRNALNPSVPTPQGRALRIFAYDPSLEASERTVDLTETTVRVRWEKLEPGPIGEYLEVIDIDPASDAAYAPVDLDHPWLLAENGLPPSEGDPQFHQQMVYAVASKTIDVFENALGRVALWAPYVDASQPYRPQYVQRLRIYPHALRTANAYYSPERKALLFGYFVATDTSGTVTPGVSVFGATSYDIVAHETTHALLDGLHPRYREATNPDMLAFHEGFADIVALFQHFTLTDLVRAALAETRADLRQENTLGELAGQFGEALYGKSALRDYLKQKPTRKDYASAQDTHSRGAVLVAAVFDAFLRIYKVKADELVVLATGGSGVIPLGQLPAPLLDALASAVSSLAERWLRICVRALDYCPPVDLTFGEYLRALVTAHTDLEPEEDRASRAALVAAFRDRGINAEGVRNASLTTLAWEPPPVPLESIGEIIPRLNLSWSLHANRLGASKRSHHNAFMIHEWLITLQTAELAALGLVRLTTGGSVAMTLIGESGELYDGELHGIEVHSVRPTRRIGSDGQERADLVIEVTQSWHPANATLPIQRGGVTLLVDLEKGAARYFIRKRIAHSRRYQQQLAFAEQLGTDTLWGNYFTNALTREPFAMLHRRRQLLDTHTDQASPQMEGAP